MALSIKDEQTDRLVRQYARLHGTNYTHAVKLAVTNALRHEGHIPGESEREQIKREFIQAMRAIRAEAAKLPILDRRPHGEILYDEDGMPK
jgi:antitoxin VapB